VAVSAPLRDSGPGAGPAARHAVLDPATRAAVLVEALPYIRAFSAQTVVVKYGGNALEGALGGSDGDALASFASDVALLRSVGIRPVVVHGGGPQIGAMMRRLGKEPVFRDGLRVTDADTLDVVRMVLVGKVNRDLVGAVNVHGPLAVGVSGEDGGLLTATARDPALGFVGDVSAVHPDLLLRLLAEDLVPVVATIATDRDGQAYNVNADTAAAAIAEEIGAAKLVYLTDVEGIRADAYDPSSLIGSATCEQLESLLAAGAVSGGMIPKVEGVLRAVRSGVARAHVLDGRVPHALLLELFSDGGIGTMVVAS